MRIQTALAALATFAGTSLAHAQVGVETAPPMPSSLAIEAGGEAGVLLGGPGDEIRDYWGTNVRLMWIGGSDYRFHEPDLDACDEDMRKPAWTRFRYDLGLDLRNGWMRRQLAEEAELGEVEGIDNWEVLGRAKGAAGFLRTHYEATNHELTAGMFAEARVGVMRVPSLGNGPAASARLDARDMSSPMAGPSSFVTGDLRFGAEAGTRTAYGSAGLGIGHWFHDEHEGMTTVSMFLLFGIRM